MGVRATRRGRVGRIVVVEVEWWRVSFGGEFKRNTVGRVNLAEF